MKRLFLCLVCCSLLFCGCGKTSYFEAVDTESTDTAVAEEISEADSSETGSNNESAGIFVQVAGAVKSPGVYELVADSRVFQAIDAAGGLLEDADDSDLNQADILTDGQKIYVPSEGETEAKEAQTSSQDTDDGLININTADAAALMELPGIGQAKADAIVTYRENNGAFGAVEDITKVSGIGDKLFAQIQAYIKI